MMTIDWQTLCPEEQIAYVDPLIRPPRKRTSNLRKTRRTKIVTTITAVAFVQNFYRRVEI
jgi:hypothetical protein